MLALDGGGVRGMISLGVLARIESIIRDAFVQSGKLQGDGQDFRLCDSFDYIGGTSTGAIIAAGLARGMSVAEIRSFYERFADLVFAKKRWHRGFVGDKFDARPLEAALQEAFPPEIDLHPQHLKCLLLAVTRNATTDSAWPISSNPAALFNAPEEASSNLRIPLWEVVRVSTAAPIYFPSKTIKVDPHDESTWFVFVDGGTTAYNNPAFALYRMATAAPYNLCWDEGEDKLLLISVGTGTLPSEIRGRKFVPSIVQNVGMTLKSLINQASIDQDINCRTVGRCTYGAPLDLEVGDLIPRDSDGNLVPLDQDLGRKFLYARYNVELSEKGMQRIGMDCGNVKLKQVSQLDSVVSMKTLTTIGEKLAAEVTPEHFGCFL